MADFTGFYFDNVHSSTYGLVRTSDGDRYKEGLIPEFEDREIELVGGDGSLYEGRRFKKTNFTIKVAFDNMTEQQLRDLRTWLGTDELKPFRFDERPYKTYWVKPSKKPELSYICFMEDDERNFEGNKIRIYKGEGEIEFTAYDPFGYCIDETTEFDNWTWIDHRGKEGYYNWQNLSTYNPLLTGGLISGEDNTTEWGFQAGLYDEVELQDFNVFTFGSAVDSIQSGCVSSQYVAKLYNPGDFEADFRLFIYLAHPGVDSSGFDITDNEDPDVDISTVKIFISQNGEDLYSFSFDTKGLNESDRIEIDTKTHSLIVWKWKEPEKFIKTLRYDLVKSTDFPKIPKGESSIKITRAIGNVYDQKGNPVDGKVKDSDTEIEIVPNPTHKMNGGIYNPHIKYNYKYY
jgi:phage-related protein